MKVLIAPNAFKESLTAHDAAQCISKGVRNAFPAIETIEIPLSDGGDGFLETMTADLPYQRIAMTVNDAIGRAHPTHFALNNSGIAILEMAKASGLDTISPIHRNIMKSNTYGTGQMINKAIELGAKKIIIGLGGSATNDAGTGMLQALGFGFLDNNNAPLKNLPTDLKHCRSIKAPSSNILNRNIEIIAACDVTNPLYGTNGATRVYAPQKGATPDDIIVLEGLLSHFDKIIIKQFGISSASKPYTGAAGGLGYALKVFLNAKLIPGFNVVSEVLDLPKTIRTVDMVISGEGRLDEQTFNGKTITRLAKTCATYNKPLVIVCGSASSEVMNAHSQHGITAVHQIIDYAVNMTDAISNAQYYLESISEKILQGEI